MNGNQTGNGFDQIGQPSPEEKRKGWLKKKRGNELAKAILSLAMEGKGNDELKRSAAEYFDLPLEEITVEALLILKQAEKAIKKADTQAFNSIMDRAYGKPMTRNELSGPEGKDLFVNNFDNITTEDLKKYVDRLEIINNPNEGEGVNLEDNN